MTNMRDLFTAVIAHEDVMPTEVVALARVKLANMDEDNSKRRVDNTLLYAKILALFTDVDILLKPTDVFRAICNDAELNATYGDAFTAGKVTRALRDMSADGKLTFTEQGKVKTYRLP